MNKRARLASAERAFLRPAVASDSMAEKKPRREMSIEKAARLYFGQARQKTREEREVADNTRQRKKITLAPVSIQKPKV
jgi:hypothetical protein